MSSLPTITVDLDALENNYRFFQKKRPSRKVAAVIKADAYGLGMEAVSRTLWRVGCDTYFVAFFEEGRRLRSYLPGATIYVLEGLPHDEFKTFLDYGLTPVLGDFKSLQTWTEKAADRLCALHIDTGMARTGFDFQEAVQIKQAFPTLGVDHLMTHYASGDDPISPQNRDQKEKFSYLKTLFPEAQTSLANSHGLFLGEDFCGDMIRVGLGLSGLLEEGLHQGSLKSAITVTAKIIQLRALRKGQSVGYNATWIADRPTRIATVAMGYADGVSRALSNKGHFYFNGQVLPICGNVSMDFTTIDVTDCSCNTLEVGASVTFFNNIETLSELALAGDTIPYEILSRLGRRCLRVYTKDF